MTSTKAYQEFLGNLYTNQLFRESFFENPLGYQASHQLEEEFITQLTTQKEAIYRFAESLIRKRLHAIHELLPLTHHLLGNTFHSTFRMYALHHHVDGVHRYHTDAIEFLAYLEKVILSTHANQLLLQNLIKLERTRNKIWQNPHQSIVCTTTLDYPLAYLNSPTEWKSEVKTKKTWWFFVRYQRQTLIDSVL